MDAVNDNLWDEQFSAQEKYDIYDFLIEIGAFLLKPHSRADELELADKIIQLLGTSLFNKMKKLKKKYKMNENE